MKKRYLLPIAIALVMSYVSTRYLFVGSGLSLIPWGIVALVFGVLATSPTDAKRLGAIYGFSQTFFFLWIDKAGGIAATQFFMLLAIISGLGVIAASCALVAANISFAIKVQITKAKRNHNSKLEG